MSSDPPPPPSAVPPPPTGSPEDVPPSKPTDNPIATAALVCSLLALVLSIIVIGAVIAVVSLVMSIVGLRRSQDLGRGKGAALGGLSLSFLALIFSAGAALFFTGFIDQGEETIRDGITSSSARDGFFPQDVLDDVECTTSDGGASALAILTVTNRSDVANNFQMTVTWDDFDGDEVNDNVRSESLDVDESRTIRLFAPSPDVEVDSCRVTRIEQPTFGIFAN